MISVVLKPGREKPVLRGHPWIFSGAVGEVKGEPACGETVEIQTSSGTFLAYGAYSPESQIRLRIWSWNQDDVIGPDFFRFLLGSALSYRNSQVFWDQSKTSSKDVIDAGNAEPWRTLRLVNAESDGFPGLIVDKYEDTLVVQFLSAGPELWRETIADQLVELVCVPNILDRSDVDVRVLEGLPQRTITLRGNPPGESIINEHGLKYRVALTSGQKTGFYLDQRENRFRLRQISSGREFLDCFSYTGGFSLNALAGGAISVTASVDRVEWLCADVFKQLRKFRDEGRSFDVIVLDPPKFAPTISHVKKAARGYKDINLLAFKLLRPGGNLATFSCSGGVNASLFQSIVAGAALDAGVTARITGHFSQSPDHPVALNFPEGAYLKGLLLQVA